MLALRSSHRGVRLHTFEPEDRAYTSTPTKIGGHALDHVVGVTLTWSRSLNKRKTTTRRSNRAECRSDPVLFAGEGDGVTPCSTTLEPSMGRFGGLSFVVNSPRCHRPDEPPTPRTAVSMPPPLCPTLAVLPPDSLVAPRNIAVDPDVSWRQHPRQEYRPEWAGENCNKEGEVAAVAPLLVDSRGVHSSSNSASIAAACAGGSGRAGPYRNMATAATRHSGALMAILLSKLANSGGGTDAALDAAAIPASAADTSEPSAAAPLSRTDLLHRSVDSVARGLDSIVDADPAAPSANGGGSWAWKARVDQTPHYSKLRRYDFVRELGSGSHGTILLVRKSPAASDHAPNVSDIVLGASKHGRASGGGLKRSNGGRDDHDGGGSSRSTAGGLRVLKESPFLAEAVNEARLLLMAGGGSGGDGGAIANDAGSRGRASDAGAGADAGDVGVAASRRGGDGGRGYQRGEVVQLHDFFVETLGHRALAFLELEYCEGGDLHDLILGGRVGRSAAAATTSAAGGRGRREASSVPWRGDAGRTGSDGGGGGSGQGRERTGRGVAGAGAAARAGDVSGLPAAQIGRVALGLCEGLQRLHERGVLHRDLKPANVLLTKSGAVRVADLGVSTSLDPSRPLTETAAGTIPFMAPEVRKFLLGSKVSYSGKADVWALGALVYAMAVGDPAPAALATQNRARLVADVGRRTGSDALALVAHRALDPDPSRRPSAHQMTSMLRGCCEREGWLARSSQGSRPVAPIARL